MGVFKRKTSKGETEFYHFKFVRGGKTYSGVCEGCTTEKAAIAYENEQRQLTDDMAKQKSVKALYDNFKEKFTGALKIELEEVKDIIPKMPSKKNKLSDRHMREKLMHWTDFSTYIEDHYPDIKCIDQIANDQALDYWEHLRNKGKYKKEISYKSGAKEKAYHSKITALSPRTCNMYLGTLKSIFKFFLESDKISKNPFAGIFKLTQESESREAFSYEELLKIQKNADDFIFPIFIIGLNTALREGDICTLRWGEINLQNRTITRKTKKTGAEVLIPIMPQLWEFFLEQHKKTKDNEYVLPEHAAMYNTNQAGITWRFKSFLEGIGIKVSKKVSGRSRAVSVKDVHSFRHTFCYLAGVNNIPLVIVQSIVGHMTKEMTAHYQKHANLKDKQEQLKKMPEFLRNAKWDLQEASKPQLFADTDRKKLAELAETLSIEKVKEILKSLGV